MGPQPFGHGKTGAPNPKREPEFEIVEDEPEFLRRTYLNVVGRIPSVYEVREFLDDPSPTKRRELVDRLLESPGYLPHFACDPQATPLKEIVA